jgi:hypothetical protein
VLSELPRHLYCTQTGKHTIPHSKAFLKEPKFDKLVKKKIPVFYGTRKSTAVFRTAGP